MYVDFYRLILGLSIPILLIGCQSQPVLQFGDCNIFVEEAHTDAERAQGLMYRENLAESAGMLFFLPKSLSLQSMGGFHMRNMQFDLDLVFLSTDKQITDIQTVPKCTTENCPIYRPQAPSDYVLEINAGQAQACGLRVGDFLDF